MPADGTSARGRKRGRPPESEEQKREKEVMKAVAKAESAKKDFDAKRKELRDSGAWWDEPSVVARLKERMEAQADRCYELEIDAIAKRHHFEEWIAQKKDVETAELVASMQREVSDIKWLSEHYDRREALRELAWKRTRPLRSGLSRRSLHGCKRSLIC